MSADPRDCRRRTLRPDQRPLPLPELAQLSVTSPVYGYSLGALLGHGTRDGQAMIAPCGSG